MTEDQPAPCEIVLVDKRVGYSVTLPGETVQVVNENMGAYLHDKKRTRDDYYVVFLKEGKVS